MSLSLAPYMQWAKQHRPSRWDLTNSNLLACEIADLPGAREALELTGDNDEGYPPLAEAIAARYGVTSAMVATAQGTSGANFLVYFALVGPGDEVLVERPGYDPLFGPIERLGGCVTRFDRRVEDGWRLDPGAVERAVTPRTRLIVLTNPHNPTGALAGDDELEAIGRLAERCGASVLVDEVYLDSVPGGPHRAAATRGPVFITTSSLTKSYGLPGLRCGWVLAAPGVAERVRRARDVVDGSGVFPAERLSVVAFQHLEALGARARSILDPNRAVFERFLERHPSLECLVPPGGTTVFPRVGGVADADPLVDRLAREFDTGVVPGRFFQAPAHFRLGLGGPLDVLEEGLRRIGQAL
ncbi:MAG: pyridoxal phosphate-dependent aminotransferase [Acidobacteria bacterium]|nr:pyridoxal phosphate-dependent aminotransferase [Acidobacteriota bacterium]